jgi:2-oxoisovalerate dehydrogenase E1 component
MISHLGPQLAIADGIALAHKLRKEKKVSVAFTGEGATSEGDFHEALNVAAVWNLPVIFIVENNGYGLSTPINEQFKCEKIADKGIGFGMKAITIDGNNILEVIEQVKAAREYCIENQKPILIECMTFRMRGHEEASGVKYVPTHLFTEWEKKDPISNYETFLVDEHILSNEDKEMLYESLKKEINIDVENGLEVKPLIPNLKDELNDIYAPHQSLTTEISKVEKTEMKFFQAIQDGLREALYRFDNLVFMGQDIAEYGGAFKITEGFVEEFGKEKIRNTPICESAIVGACLGLSIQKMKSMMEMQFADFVTVGFNQIINNLAKIHYRWGQNADVVIRMPTGAGVGAGPFHSQSNEAWFAHTPGLKVVYPSSPSDAKGLLLASFEDPNPVLFFEHKALYRSISEEVPAGYYTVEIGKAKVVKEGIELGIITYGMGVHWAKKYADAHPEIDIAILDLRTLLPLDYDAIEKIVKATGKIIILHEDCLTGGFGGEISAWISEHCFEYLDAPIMRCASLDTPIPFAIELEKEFLANARFDECVEKIMAY